MTDPADQERANTTPNALLVWDNRARLSLPPMLMAWLGFLVVVCLASVFFVRDHPAARWVLGGFVLSHAIVFLLPAITNFTMRRGFVSLMHIVCWTPGLVAVALDTSGRAHNPIYAYWSYTLIAVLLVSFVFDVRDACVYLYYAAKGKLPK